MDAGLRLPRGPHADLRLRANARGRNGGVRQELAQGVAMNHYRIALALTLALVLLVVGLFLYLGGVARFPRSAVTLPSLTFVVLLGLWLQSYFFRYCGGVLFLVLGGFYIWTTYSEPLPSALLNSYWFI